MEPSAKINFFFNDFNSFAQNDEKIGMLRQALSNPALIEALNLILSMEPPTRGSSMESYALTCAYRDGMLAVGTRLFALANNQNIGKDYSDKALQAQPSNLN